MEIKDLKPADILVFSGEKGSAISALIMFLTDSRVSHGAMSYTGCNTIVEESPPNVKTGVATERFSGRTIYVQRMKEAMDMSPVLSAATGYLTPDPAPYAHEDLYLVGALLAFRKFTPSGPLQRLILHFLKKLVLKLEKLIDGKKYPNQRPMVCSQFVYQCYQDAGNKYTLQLKNPLLDSSVKLNTRSLIELAEDMEKVPALSLSPEKLEEKTFEKLAEELLDELKKNQKAEKVADELLHMVSHFAHHFLGKRTDLHSAAGAFKQEASTFVTPVDLLNCSNTSQVGIIEINPT